MTNQEKLKIGIVSRNQASIAGMTQAIRDIYGPNTQISIIEKPKGTPEIELGTSDYHASLTANTILDQVLSQALTSNLNILLYTNDLLLHHNYRLRTKPAHDLEIAVYAKDVDRFKDTKNRKEKSTRRISQSYLLRDDEYRRLRETETNLPLRDAIFNRYNTTREIVTRLTTQKALKDLGK